MRRSARGAIGLFLVSVSAAAVSAPEIVRDTTPRSPPATGSADTAGPAGAAADTATGADVGPPPLTQPAGSLGRTTKLLDELASTERTLRARHALLGQRLQEVERLRSARGRSYVRLIRAGLLPAGDGFGALVDHASKVERLRHALLEDAAREHRWRSERLAVGAKLDEVRTRRGALAEEHSLIERSHAAVAAAEEREAAFRRAFLGGSAPDGHTAVYAATPSAFSRAEAHGGFAALRGNLPLPVAGRIEVSDARVPGSDGPGLDLRTTAGNRVTALFPGRVAFADHTAGYGQTVLLDHGDDYFTVYAKLGASSVKAGEELDAGTALGSAGTGGVVYVEVRHAGHTVDPRPWFGL